MSELMNENGILDEEEQITFIVDDDQKAEWCLDKIREAQAEKDRWTDFYMDRLKKICDQEDARIEHLKYMLRDYFRTVPHKVSKTQESYQLPSGKLTLKEQKPEWIHDDAQLLPWVKVNQPAHIKTKETVDWMELKKDLTVIWNEDGSQTITNSDGLIVPGITVEERPDVFRVEVK